MGLATAPTLAYYASAESASALANGGATALFMVGLGAAGYGSRRDLSAPRLVSACGRSLALDLVGCRLDLRLKSRAAISSTPSWGLAGFAGLTMYDFQRLRKTPLY